MDPEQYAKLRRVTRLAQEILDAERPDEYPKQEAPEGDIMTSKEVCSHYRVSKQWLSKHKDELPRMSSGSTRPTVRYSKRAMDAWWTSHMQDRSF